MIFFNQLLKARCSESISPSEANTITEPGEHPSPRVRGEGNNVEVLWEERSDEAIQ